MERLATLRTYQETLVLETMYWPDEIRSTGELELPSGKAVSPAPKEIQMARTLIENLASHFDPDQYKDDFRSTLMELIQRKMRGDRRSAKRRKPDPKVVDLMEALQASLSASKAPKVASGTAAASAKRKARARPLPREGRLVGGFGEQLPARA